MLFTRFFRKQVAVIKISSAINEAAFILKYHYKLTSKNEVLDQLLEK